LQQPKDLKPSTKGLDVMGSMKAHSHPKQAQNQKEKALDSKQEHE
jgi:hypothetical protein